MAGSNSTLSNRQQLFYIFNLRARFLLKKSDLCRLEKNRNIIS